ncbi:MAG: FKBP-type peptidyl-prolyl cis-trans isomerase [Phycisphaerales bacterium]|nr:MAG: FKBP-type peptidyl-prolyl cis-trans isomerase [Phycisphaerales bacterium]
MAQAKYGDEVKLHYTGKLTNGRVFDSSVDRDAMVLTIGQEKMFFDFEQALIGMSPGESKRITVSSDRAFGPYREDLVIEVDSRNIAPDLEAKVGQRVEVSRSDGETAVVTITAVTETGVTIDGNHPLAGQDLTFDVELVEIA